MLPRSLISRGFLESYESERERERDFVGVGLCEEKEESFFG